MAQNKTQRTDDSVVAYLDSVENDKKRRDSFTIMKLMQEVTGTEPAMWGSSIVGFGEYTYKYASGREGEWFLVGFAPRKQNLTLYINGGFDNYEPLLSKLGKYSTGKSCLYIKKTDDVDLQVLKELVAESVDHMKATNE